MYHILENLVISIVRYTQICKEIVVITK